MSSENVRESKVNKKDYRISCIYGAKCYQKNPFHHSKYKHPLVTKNEDVKHQFKRRKIEADLKEKTINKIEDSDTEKNEDNLKNKRINNDVSSSDESESDLKDKRENKTEKENDQMERTEKVVGKINTNNAKIDTNEVTDHEINKKPMDHQSFIEEKFLVKMPEDFFKFWDFCKEINPKNPLNALSNVGLMLVGPFDVLADKFKDCSKTDEEYLIHWRYYRDPPEFQTVLSGDNKTGYHIGYFRDSPEELPVLVASNHCFRDGVFSTMGETIFSALNFYLEDLKKSGDPFQKMHINTIQTALKCKTEDLKINLSKKTENIISREKKIVARTFNKIGLVVPYNKKTQLGYRELALGDKELKNLLTKLDEALPEQKSKYLSELQPVLTYANIAADECDFGTGIELGWNIISHGTDCLNSTASRFLAANYKLLNRDAFAKIATAHMKNRRKGCDLSIL